VYGVDHKIDFILGDFFQIARFLKADVLFLSPPWGGPDYLSLETYDLNMMQPRHGSEIFDFARNITENIAYFVPRNTDINQLTDLAGSGCCEIQPIGLNNKVKALTAYYGNLVNKG
jgi:trimethylguanosine synthase